MSHAEDTPLVPGTPPVAPHPEPERVFGLDLLRTAAILGVSLAHGFDVIYPHFYQLGLLGHGGFYGVELFFVLSGFLIGQILIRAGPKLGSAEGLGGFYVRRWCRTLPLYWLFIAINVGLEILLYQHRLGVGDILGHAFFLCNIAAHHITFIPESWSLAVEEWFYLLFPAALALGLRLRGKFTPVLLTVAVLFYLFSTGARLLTAGNPGYEWSGAPRVLVVNRFDALMTGVLAAWLSVRYAAGWRRHARVCAVLGGLLAVAMYATLWRPEGAFVTNAHDSFFARTWRFNLVSLGFALLLPAASGWTLVRETWWSVPTRKIALWSYSIYLIHQPLIHLLRHYCFLNSRQSAAAAYGAFATQVVLMIALSAGFYHFYEAPCTRLREKIVPALARFCRR
jgi:peptidoglycan/LPS O-acetylase OafA/YrhL